MLLETSPREPGEASSAIATSSSSSMALPMTVLHFESLVNAATDTLESEVSHVPYRTHKLRQRHETVHGCRETQRDWGWGCASRMRRRRRKANEVSHFRAIAGPTTLPQTCFERCRVR